MCTERKQRATGFTLPELLLLIIVFAIGLSGILLVINNTVARSADPMLRKQAMAAAESMLEEILLQSAAPEANVGAGRQNFNDVADYDEYKTTGIQTIDGTPVAGLGNYNLEVTVSDATVGGVSAQQVTVVISGASDFSIDGYKFAYD